MKLWTRKLLGLGMVLGFSALTSCAPTFITPLHQASPNPMAGAKRFEIRDVEYVNLMVDGKSETVYKAGIGQEAFADWDEDKYWIAKYFTDNVKSTAGSEGVSVSQNDRSAPFVIVPTVSMIDTGYYRIPAWNAVSRVNYRVRILDRSGKRIDELEAVHGIPFDAMFAPSTSGRLQNVAEALGEAVGEYVVERSYE